MVCSLNPRLFCIEKNIVFDLLNLNYYTKYKLYHYLVHKTLNSVAIPTVPV